MRIVRWRCESGSVDCWINTLTCLGMSIILMRTGNVSPVDVLQSIDGEVSGLLSGR